MMMFVIGSVDENLVCNMRMQSVREKLFGRCDMTTSKQICDMRSRRRKRFFHGAGDLRVEFQSDQRRDHCSQTNS